LHIFKNAAPLNSIHSVRKMFHRTEMGMKRSKYFLSWISVGRLRLVSGVAGMARAAGSVHIDSIVLFLFSDFPIFLFSSFLVSLFSSFILSYLYICIFHICIFVYLCICIFAYFQKCSAREQNAFRQEDVS
jgi:hypothetical protein